jgi:hypothetical protein
MLQKALSRLATVRHPALSTLALALAAAATMALVSCGGGGDAKLLPGNTAQEITENLDRVQQYAEEGECVGAEDAVAEITTQVESLQGVDPKLEDALRRGAARLGEVVASCEEEDEEDETVSPAEESPSTEETERTPPGQEKKLEKEREKEERDQEKEAEKAEKEAEKETPPAESPAGKTTPVAPPSESGGTGAGGVGPAAPVESGQGDEG